MVKVSAYVIRQAVRFCEEGYSQREIGRFCQIGKGSVFRLLSKAEELDLTSAELDSMTDAELEQRFFPSRSEPRRDKVVPDFRKVHDHLRHTHHRSLMHEWFDYREQNPDGYSYSRFLDLYRQWCRKFSVKPVLLRNEEPGKCMYIDWSSDTVTVILDNEEVTIYFFVTSIGASELAYVEPFLDMSTESYIAGNVHALRYYGAVPKVLVPDNCKTAVIRNEDNEVDLNEAFKEMAAYYQCVVLPARPRSPTDKNDVEANVHHSEDWIISDIELHKEQFHSFRDIQIECRRLLDRQNQQKFRGTDFNRWDWFRDTDLPEMKILTQKDFVLRQRYYMTVPNSYHVHIKGDRQQYSVPYQYISKDVVILYDLSTLEVYLKGYKPNDLPIARRERVYSSRLNTVNTNPAHRPESHQIAVNLGVKDSEWYLAKAREIGPYTEKLIHQLLVSRGNPESMYKSCMGVITMTWSGHKDRVTKAELEGACRYALAIHSNSKMKY